MKKSNVVFTILFVILFLMIGILFIAVMANRDESANSSNNSSSSNQRIVYSLDSYNYGTNQVNSARSFDCIKDFYAQKDSIELFEPILLKNLKILYVSDLTSGSYTVFGRTTSYNTVSISLVDKDGHYLMKDMRGDNKPDKISVLNV